MPNTFHQSTAEDLIASVQAVVANGPSSTPAFVSSFVDIPLDRATMALKLAADLGLVREHGGNFREVGPLSRLFASPMSSVRIAVLRIALEDYEPFVQFRARLMTGASAADAAHQTRILLDFQEHRDAIKDTLISLGTFSHALETQGGGLYVPAEPVGKNELLSAAQGCANLVAAEARVRVQLGNHASEFVNRDTVILPLADALLRASTGDARGAVVAAGNAIETYLLALGTALGGVPLAGANGVNAKLDRFVAPHRQLPRKLVAVGKYLGNIRNAADHGAGDPDVANQPWAIQESTGTEFVFVSCSFIAATDALRRNMMPAI